MSKPPRFYWSAFTVLVVGPSVMMVVALLLVRAMPSLLADVRKPWAITGVGVLVTSIGVGFYGLGGRPGDAISTNVILRDAISAGIYSVLPVAWLMALGWMVATFLGKLALVVAGLRTLGVFEAFFAFMTVILLLERLARRALRVDEAMER